MLTGSIMFKALGFQTLKAEKQHVNVHVIGRPAPEPDPDVLKYMDFVSCNEINAITTPVGLIMPALLPTCLKFFEVGPKFIHGSQ